MRVIIMLVAGTLGAAAQQNGTVGLTVAQIYNDTAPDKRGPAVVVVVLANSPAAKAGIRGGDIVVGMNGAPVSGKAAGETLDASLTGPLGGSVKLTLWRESEARQFEADLTRVAYPLRSNPASDPFEFYSPANWRQEADRFPLPWSPQLTYQGSEDLVFAPGFPDKSSPNYHSYAFVWWLEGKVGFSAARLQADLLTYYKGISDERARTRKFTADPDRVSVALMAEPVKAGEQSFHGDATFYDPAGQLLTLHGEIALQFCADGKHTAGVFILSPQEPGAAIWKDLRAIRESFRCRHHTP